MIEILTNALWVTLIAYIVFVIGKWIYIKFLKPDAGHFFYFISLKKDIQKENYWYLRLEAPYDEFEVKIEVLNESVSIFNKNAHLKAGINSIAISDSKFSSSCIIRIQSDSQQIERSLIEAEV